ncbi:hypothetical protein ACHAWF_001480 [Thalassiosira exigua]
MEASKRMKEAVPEKAEAVRIQAVKDVEARAERAHLNGVGVARERREIARGMSDIVDSVVGDDDAGRNDNIPAKGVMDLLLLTQYFDDLTYLNGVRQGRKNGDEANEGDEYQSPSLFMTHMPGTVSQLTETARACFGDATAASVKVENLLDL